jgi:hypothetical protein
MASITQQFRSKAESRVKELQPAVAEYHELIEFLDMTSGSKTATKTKAKAKPKAKAKSRSRKRTATKATGKRRGRKPERAMQFTKLIQDNPGLTVREASKKMQGVNETYLHRIGKDLVEQGALRKEGSAYFPANGNGKSVVVEPAPVVTETPAVTPEAETL